MCRIRSSKSKIIVLSLVISLTAFMLSGCGADGQTSGTPQPSPAPASTPIRPHSDVNPRSGDSGSKSRGPGIEPTGSSLAGLTRYFLIGTTYTPNTLIDPEKARFSISSTVSHRKTS